MLSIGIDVHLRNSTVCILDRNGKEVRQFQVRGGPRKLIEELLRIKEPFAVCFEASCGYGFIFDELRRIARRVVVAHPGQVRLIFRSKKKNDRIDARKLATLLFLDQVPAVYVPSVDVRSWRAFIEYRGRLIAKRSTCKNELRALFRMHGIDTPWRTNLWSKAGVKWLAEMELPTPRAMLQRDLAIEQLRSLCDQLRRVERELNAMGRRNTGVQLLQTIPGVGPRTSEAFVAYIDDPQRFARSKQVGSYLGLVPCQDQSGASNRLGHITREGPATVRKLLTEAAWSGIRVSPRLRAFFERVCSDDPQRRRIALVATAHYMARVMYRMLRTGEIWRAETETPKAAVA